MSTGGINRNSEADRASMARIEATGWGLFFLWVGVALVASVGWGIALLGTGVISLAVQSARRLSGLSVCRWSVGFGACLTWPAWCSGSMSLGRGALAGMGRPGSLCRDRYCHPCVDLGAPALIDR